jgi:hypothetical protein
VVSLTSLSLDLWGKLPRYPLDRTTWRRENFCPCRNSNSDPSVVQPLADRYPDYCTALCTQIYCLYCDLFVGLLSFLPALIIELTQGGDDPHDPHKSYQVLHTCANCAQRENAVAIPRMNEVGWKEANYFQPLQSSDARNSERYQLTVSRNY